MGITVETVFILYLLLCTPNGWSETPSNIAYVIGALGYFCLLCFVIIRYLTNHLAANCYVFNTNSIEFVNKITVKYIADDVQQYSTHCSFSFQLVYLVLHQNN